MPQNIAILGTSLSLLSSALSVESYQISLFELENLENKLKNSHSSQNTEESAQKESNFKSLTRGLFYDQVRNTANLIDEQIISIELCDQINQNETLETENNSQKIQNFTTNSQENSEQNENYGLEGSILNNEQKTDKNEQTFEKDFETLKTDNLLIKKLNAGHSKFIWLNYTTKVSQYLKDSWQSFEDLEIDLDKKLGENIAKKRIDLAILDRENGDFIGVCEIGEDQSANRQKNTETNTKNKILKMDFWFKEKVWNQGYGQEMAMVVYNWLIKNMEFEKLILNIEKNNTFARKIAEKLGGIAVVESAFVKNEKDLTFLEYAVQNKTIIIGQNVEIDNKNSQFDDQEKKDNLQNSQTQNLINNSQTVPKNLFRIITKSQKFYFDKIITSSQTWHELENKFGKNLTELNSKLTKLNKKHELEENCPEHLQNIENIKILAKNGIFLLDQKKPTNSTNFQINEFKNKIHDSNKETLEEIQIGLQIAQKIDNSMSQN